MASQPTLGPLLHESRRFADALAAARGVLPGTPEVLHDLVGYERALRGELVDRVIAPVDAVLDLLEESGAALHQQADALEQAGRALERSAALMKHQAELFERTIAMLRQPADAARAVGGAPARPRRAAGGAPR